MDDETTIACLDAIGREYGLAFDYASIPDLLQEHGLEL